MPGLRPFLPLLLLSTPGLPGADLPPVGVWSPLEVRLPADPAHRDLRPRATFTRPDGTRAFTPGFAMPDGSWRAAVAADQPGAWSNAVAADGRVHRAYSRDGALYHRLYDAAQDQGSAEEDTTLRPTGSNEDGPHRGDPDVVSDGQGRPHVLVGRRYASKDEGRWLTADSGLHPEHMSATGVILLSTVDADGTVGLAH